MPLTFVVYIIRSMADNKEFIKENIVGRKDSWKKRLRHYVRIVLSALIFGILSAAVFAAAEPLLEKRFHKEEPETVTLETETTAAPVTEAVTEAPTVAETEPIQQVVQSELKNYAFSVSDYESVLSDLAKIASAAEDCLVEVKKNVSGTDFLGEPLEAQDSFSGIVIAHTYSEFLILTSDQAAQDTSSVEVSFLRDHVYAGTIKGVDHKDGFAVISVPVASMQEADVKNVGTITIGNSRLLKKGGTLIAIGAPANVLYSSAYGMVSYITYNYSYVDCVCEVIVSDLVADPSKGTFIINTGGELVGWISSKLGTSAEGYQRIAGSSDFVDWIEAISNGQQIPYIGLSLQDVTKEMQTAGLPAGIYVRSAEQDSPAFAAGIQSGDIITKINDIPVASAKDYSDVLSTLKPSQEITVAALRQRGAEYAEVPFTLTVSTR